VAGVVVGDGDGAAGCAGALGAGGGPPPQPASSERNTIRMMDCIRIMEMGVG